MESGVEGCGHLPEGTIVCKGVHMNEVGRAPRWYTPPPGRRPPKHIFRVRYVVDPNLEMEDPSETVKLPNRKGDDKILRKGPKRVSIEANNKVIAELARRAMMDFEEGNCLLFAVALLTLATSRRH